MKTKIELQKEFWSRPEAYFTPKMVNCLIQKYKGEPATYLEAIYQLKYYTKQLFNEIINSIKIKK